MYTIHMASAPHHNLKAMSLGEFLGVGKNTHSKDRR